MNDKHEMRWLDAVNIYVSRFRHCKSYSHTSGQVGWILFCVAGEAIDMYVYL